MKVLSTVFANLVVPRKTENSQKKLDPGLSEATHQIRCLAGTGLAGCAASRANRKGLRSAK